MLFKRQNLNKYFLISGSVEAGSLASLLEGAARIGKRARAHKRLLIFKKLAAYLRHWFPNLQRTPSRDDVNQKDHQGHYQDQVDQRARVKHCKAEQPENEQYHKNCPKHHVSSCIFMQIVRNCFRSTNREQWSCQLLLDCKSISKHCRGQDSFGCTCIELVTVRLAAVLFSIDLPGAVGGQFRCKCPINFFSLSRRYDKLKLIGHQTDPL
jgi:hypothetical protein